MQGVEEYPGTLTNSGAASPLPGSIATAAIVAAVDPASLSGLEVGDGSKVCRGS